MSIPLTLLTETIREQLKTVEEMAKGDGQKTYRYEAATQASVISDLARNLSYKVEDKKTKDEIREVSIEAHLVFLKYMGIKINNE